jgi:hypothetical protein
LAHNLLEVAAIVSKDNCSPAAVLQQTEESDIQRDSKQEEPPIDVCIDVMCNPKADPVS